MRCFSSPAYLHTAYVFSGGSQGSPPCGVSPFGDPRLTACARLPEAFRRYATSFIGTDGLGIHPTPFVTVAQQRGVAPVATAPCTILMCIPVYAHAHDNALLLSPRPPRLLRYTQPSSTAAYR